MQRPKISLTDVTVFIKTSLVGFFALEIWQVANTFGKESTILSKASIEIFGYYNLFLSSAAILILTLVYVWFRDGVDLLKRVLLSFRLDLAILFIAGGVLSAMIHPTLAALTLKHIKAPPEVLTLTIFSAILLWMLVLVADAALQEVSKRRRKPLTSFFVSDTELSSSEKDLLGHATLAEAFASQLWNGGASDSLVFGVDAPWGIGKSTFVNFVIERFEADYGNNTIIFRFNPLKYHDKSKYLEKLIDGLIKSISEKVFHPELSSLLKTYTKELGGKLGLKSTLFKFDLDETSVDTIYEQLERAILKLNTRIIVIVDDLDRIDYTEAKEILFAIKKGFMLPNLSYILLYDTENILALDTESDDPEKIREFLEKFVNIKISLFLDSKKLGDYITSNFEKAVQDNILLDTATLAKTKGLFEALREILNGSDFHQYQSVAGDIRKIKRLINTVLLLEIHTTEFETADFNKEDLLHLLLIYLNYPHVFRKIFDTETNERSGFFSAVRSFKLESNAEENPNSRHGWQNSSNYSIYIENLPPTQKFLVEKIFSIKHKFNNQDKPDEQATSTLACFNTVGSSRNLERYLNLIVRKTKPLRAEQYGFYFQWYARILEQYSINAPFATDEFSRTNDESSHELLWRIITNKARYFRLEKIDEIVDYLLENIPAYATVELATPNLGLRNKFPIYLLHIMNSGGWQDSSGMRTQNTEGNTQTIAHRIFGEDRYLGRGIIEILTKPERGVLGLFDALLFRLYACANRDSDLFNLQRALGKHASSNTPTSGPVTYLAIEQMRELSQLIVSRFLHEYRGQGKNLLMEIEGLSQNDLVGSFMPCVQNALDGKKIQVDELAVALALAKSRLKMFVCYQLGAISTDSGVTCGHYDLNGSNDSHSISNEFNNYLFEFCFDPVRSSTAFETFIDYLMISYPSGFVWESERPQPSEQSFTQVLKRESLITYWRAHRERILNSKFEENTKTIRTANYTLSYDEHLFDVYTLLDVIAGIELDLD